MTDLAAQILVLAKEPVPGRVKTRLTPPFTPAQAAALAEASLADTLAALPVPVVLIGMDTPQVTAGLLEAAVEPLARTMADSAFGPAEDGGFWMLGLRLPDPDLTLGVPMSEPVTGRAQLVRLIQAGLRIHMTPELVDVDTLAAGRYRAVGVCRAGVYRAVGVCRAVGVRVS